MSPSKIAVVALDAAFIFGYQMADMNAIAPAAVLKLLGPSVQAEPVAAGSADSLLNSKEGQFFLAAASTMFFAGTTLGSILGGVLGDRIGRKSSSMVSYCFYLVGTALELALVELGTLGTIGGVKLTGGMLIYAMGRLLNGMGVGVAHVVILMYLLETVPRPHLRGRYGTLFQLCITFGIVVPNLLSTFLSDPQIQKHGPLLTSTVSLYDSIVTRLILALPLLLTLCGLSLIPYMPESPVYVLLHPETHQSIDNVLKRIDADYAVTPADPSQPHPRISELRDATSPATGGSQRRSLLRNAQPGDTETRRQISVNRRAVGLAVLFVVLVQMTGINVILATANLQMNRVGFDTSEGIKISFTLTLLNLLLTLPAIYAVDKFGRMTLVKTCAFVCATGAALVEIAIAMMEPTTGKWLALAGLLLFVGSFALGIGSIMFLYVNELLPASIRSSANGIVIAINWAAAGFTVVGGSIVPPSVIYPVVIACCLALTGLAMWLPETKDCPFGRSPIDDKSSESDKSSLSGISNH